MMVHNAVSVIIQYIIILVIISHRRTEKRFSQFVNQTTVLLATIINTK